MRWTYWLLAGIGLCLCGPLAAIGAVSAPTAPAARPVFVAVNLGSLGGPNVVPNDPGRSISPSGVVLASSDTRTLDPFANDPGCLESPCHANYAFEWRAGRKIDLGALKGYASGLFELNAAGVGVGVSETGKLDQQTGFPETHGVVSYGGRLHDLGTLGGHESWASGINNRGQVAGYAANKTPDPYAQDFSPYPSATQWRATIWQGGKAHSLGTLGGPDSLGGLLNERGQAAGESFTNFTPNAATGVPTMHPFLWSHGKMRDLGTLGGTFGFSMWMNGRGEVVGVSDLAGDQTADPFLWNGHRLVDLGTLGGGFGVAYWVNDAGTVVGSSNLSGDSTQHGFLWRRGVMRDLPPVTGAPCSNAYAINDKGEAVGNATDCQGNALAAMAWYHGAAIDLNSVIGPFPVHLTEAFYINNRGQIACLGTLKNGNTRVVLLTPRGQAASQLLAAAHTPALVASHLSPSRATRDPRDGVNSARQLAFRN